ncbi:MAG: hypothetical protein O7H41_15130 [Planctomycetota bacterium]|nr:hypothetical protein [Planctomycetota bacterium]
MLGFPVPGGAIERIVKTAELEETRSVAPWRVSSERSLAVGENVEIRVQNVVTSLTGALRDHEEK